MFPPFSKPIFLSRDSSAYDLVRDASPERASKCTPLLNDLAMRLHVAAGGDDLEQVNLWFPWQRTGVCLLPGQVEKTPPRARGGRFSLLPPKRSQLLIC